jgi:hypothetical protein
MTDRIATLNATQLIQLDALRDVLNLPSITELIAPEESLDLFYGSLLQAGVKKLEIDGPQFDDMTPRAEFLKNRIVWRKGKEWGEIFSVVNEVFSRHISEPQSDKDQNLGIILFLIDLLYALARRKPVIRVISQPNLSAQNR